MNRRILFVIESLFELGPFLQLRPLLSSLSDKGFVVHFSSMQPDIEPRLKMENVEFHFVPKSNRPLNQSAKLRECLTDLRPDIVHAWGHECHNRTRLALAGLNEQGQPGKRVFTFFEVPDANGTFETIGRRVLKSSDEIVAVPHQSMKETLFENKLANGKVEIIPNSITHSSDQRDLVRQHLSDLANLETHSQLYFVGTVGTFDTKYRLKDLVWAIDLLCCIRKDVHLFIFATGDDAKLRRFISMTEAGTNIHIIPLASTAADHLSSLDFYWNAQTRAANPTPMLTAMSRGIPSVSVYADETKDVILPLQSGLATNYGARDEFARWTKFLIEQDKARSQISHQGKAHAELRFPIRNMTSGYLSLYA